MKLNLDIIASYSASQIADSVRSGDVKAIDVLKAMRNNAKKSNKYNCIVQFLDEYSFKRAEWIDEKISQCVKFTKEEYPLLGVPISVKDCFGIKGYESTIGLDKFVGIINEKTHPFIDALEKSGAIPFCTTHVSQLMATLSSTNSHGVTFNPYNHNYTAGGSSSGEGALIGSNGSILGVAGDVGGSIRIPSAFCGIYGLKPTPKRLNEIGDRELKLGQESVIATIGPMANHVQDLDLMIRAALKEKPWEISHSVVPIPYREVTLPKKLRIGYYLDDGIYPATPAVERAVIMAVEALKAAGHDVFPYKEPALKGSSALYIKIDNLDKSQPKFEMLESNSKMTREVNEISALHKLPKWVVWLFTLITEKYFGEKEFANAVWDAVAGDANTVFKANHQRENLEKKHFEAWNNAVDQSGRPMDFVICPISVLPSFKHNKFIDVAMLYGSSFLYNLLGNTAGVIPVSRVNRGIDGIEDLDAWLKSKVSKEYDGKFHIHKTAYSQYDADKMHGLPVAIQVVGRKFEEEKVAKGMELIDKILKEYDHPNKYTTYSQYQKESY